MGNPFGRNTIIALTNKSGASVAAGDFVYVSDGTNADSFTTGTTANRTSPIGIAQATIANGAVGLVLIEGYAALVNVNASVTLGHFLASYTVAKQGTDAGASRAAGTCGIFMTGGATPDAIIWQPDLGAGSGMTNPMTNSQDIIVGGTAGAPGRLAIGAAGGALVSLNSVLAYNSGTSMPTNKATGDRYWRTDLNLEFTWDGTRWVTTTLYREPLAGGQDGASFSAGSKTIGMLPMWHTDYDLWVVALYTAIFVNGTSDGSNFWTIDLNKDNSAFAETSIANLVTSGYTASTLTTAKTAVGASVVQGTNKQLRLRATTMTGSPGALFISASVAYRLIGT